MLVKAKVAQLSNSEQTPTPNHGVCDPMDCSLPASSVHEDSPGNNTGVGCHALLRGIFPNPGIEQESLTLQMDYLSAELPGVS